MYFSYKYQSKILFSLILFFAVTIQTSFVSLAEDGELGNPSTWVSQEFEKNWGLGAIKAHHAYARGFTGKNIKLGIIDTGVWRDHYEFKSPGKVIGLLISGTRDIADEYNPDTSRKGDRFSLDGGVPYWGLPDPKMSATGFAFFDHGTHVAGIMAARRNGRKLKKGELLHGVSFASAIVSAQGEGLGPANGIADTYDPAVFRSSVEALIREGTRVINNSWGIEPDTQTEYIYQSVTGSSAKKFKDNTYKFEDVVDQYMTDIQHKNIDTAEAATRAGVILVYAAGNSYSSQPSTMSGLPYFKADPVVENHYVTVVSIDEPKRKRNHVLSDFSSVCGYTKYWCVSAPGNEIYSSVVPELASSAPTNDEFSKLKSKYASYSGTSMAAPHVSGALGLVMERYPYMSSAGARTVLLTTADYLKNKPKKPFDAADYEVSEKLYIASAGDVMDVTDYPEYTYTNTKKVAEVPDEIFGWGLINLKRAMDGPAQFLGNFEVDMPRGTYDIWENEISDLAIRKYKEELEAENDEWLLEKEAKGWDTGLSATESIEDKRYYEYREARADMLATRQWYGSLTKKGGGILSLRGNASYKGSTRILGGVLDINSGTDLPLTFDSPVLVGADGRLQADNVIFFNDITIKGTIAPGDYVSPKYDIILPGSAHHSGKIPQLVKAIGTINIIGNYVQKADSTYEVDIDPIANTSDLISVTGTAEIEKGAKVVVSKVSNAPVKVGARYTIIDATQVDGNYDQNDISGSGNWISAFMVASLVENDKKIDLLFKKGRDLEDAATTENTRAVAHEFDNLARKNLEQAEKTTSSAKLVKDETQTTSVREDTIKPDNPLETALNNLPDDQAAEAALKQITGEVHASGQLAMITQASIVSNLAQSRSRSTFSSVIAAPAPVKKVNSGDTVLNYAPVSNTPKLFPLPEPAVSKDFWHNVEIWGRGIASFAKIDGNGNASGSRLRANSMVIGIDKGFVAGQIPWRVGLIAGFGTGKVSTRAVSSNLDSRDYMVGVYGGGRWHDLGLNASVVYGYHTIKTDRYVKFAGFEDRLKADYTAKSLQFSVGADYEFRLNNRIAVAPFANISHNMLRTSAFSEKGGLASLQVKKARLNKTTATIGIDTRFAIGNPDLPIDLRFNAGWRHTFGNNKPSISTKLASLRQFKTKGLSFDKNAFVGGVGFEVRLSNKLKLNAFYNLELSRHVRNHEFTIRLGYQF